MLTLEWVICYDTFNMPVANTEKQAKRILKMFFEYSNSNYVTRDAVLRNTGIKPNTFSNYINILKNQNLVTTLASPIDARKTGKVMLTTQGHQLLGHQETTKDVSRHFYEARRTATKPAATVQFPTPIITLETISGMISTFNRQNPSWHMEQPVPKPKEKEVQPK